MNLYRASFMQLALRLQVSLMSFVRRRESPEVQSFAIGAYCRAKLTPPFFKRHPQSARSVARLGVPLIFNIRPRLNVAQVTDPVIRWIAVTVVNEIAWPPSVKMKPYQSVHEKLSSVYLHANVPASKYCSDDIARVPSASRESAGKAARFGVVVKQLADALCSKIRFGHVTLLSGCVARAAVALQRFSGPIILAPKGLT